MIVEAIKTVLKEMRLNKVRTFLTMLGIIVGIISLTIIFAISNATKKYMRDTVSSIGTELTYYDIFNVDKPNLAFINKDLNDYVKNNDQIKMMSKATTFEFKEYDRYLEMNADNEYSYIEWGEYLAIDENYKELNKDTINDKNILFGRFLSRKDIITQQPYIVIGETVANSLFETKNAVGKRIIINNFEFEIVGIIKSNASDFGMNELADAYISYYFAESYFNLDSAISYYFSPSKNGYTQEMKKDIEKILNEYISIENYYSFSVNLDSIMSEIDSIVGVVELVFIGIASLSIIVGGIGIMNIMLVSVSERIKETGIRMALGAKNSDIVFQFLIEGIMLTIFSGILGILIAIIITNVANIAIIKYTPYTFKLIVNLITMIKIIVFCGLLGIIFGIYPALKAGRLDPVEALKYE